MNIRYFLLKKQAFNRLLKVIGIKILFSHFNFESLKKFLATFMHVYDI
jgi:hypothetical protein